MGTPTLQATRAIPLPEEQPTMSVPDAGMIFGLGRAASYVAVQRGDIPSIRVGRKVLVPTAALRRLVGLDDTEPSTAA